MSNLKKKTSKELYDELDEMIQNLVLKSTVSQQDNYQEEDSYFADFMVLNEDIY